jgi:hypothetical protein
MEVTGFLTNRGLFNKKQVLAESSQRTYRDIVQKNLLPYFASMPVNTITKVVVERSVVQLVATLTATHANKCLFRFRGILVDAADDYDFVTKIKNIKPLVSYTETNPNEDEFLRCRSEPTLLRDGQAFADGDAVQFAGWFAHRGSYCVEARRRGF